MRHVRTLIESRPFLSRVPDQKLLVDEGSGSEHRRACRGDGYIFVYLPQGGTVTLNVSSLAGPLLRAWWFDPRTGCCCGGETLPVRKQMSFSAPWLGPCSDWVLVLDNAAMNFPPPGPEGAWKP
jgi:hypothetical protein